MPIDGVSFSNSGFNIVNPSEVNVQAEAAARKEAEKRIKEPEESEKTKEDNEEEDDEKERDLQGRYSEEEDKQEKKFKEIKTLNKKYLVKFNSSTEMVEMHDAVTGEVIETLSPEDLIKVLSKSKAFSGVLVDRKI